MNGPEWKSDESAEEGVNMKRTEHLECDEKKTGMRVELADDW